jgi:hypothetical protein
MVQREITLPIDTRGGSTLPRDAANLPIVPLMEALITAGWSDHQVRQALQGIISDQEREDDELGGRVIEFVCRVT